MSEVLLVNPRRRRRSPTRRRKVTRARRRNPVKRRKRTVSRRRRSYRRRSNPALRLNARSIQNNVMNAVPGAFGALALDVGLGYLPMIPAQWKTGIAGYVVKALGAIGLGMIASNVVKKATAVKMTEGALTVMMHGALRNGMQQFAPNVPLSMYEENGVGYYGSGWNPNYVDDPDAMAAYLPDMANDPLTTDEQDLGAYIGDEEQYM